MSPQTSSHPSNEPSLEDILSSIRRIMSEEGPTTAQAALNVSDSWPPATEAEELEEAREDVLVLTERVPMNGQTFLHAEPVPHSEPVLHAEPQTEVSGEIVQTWDEADAGPINVEPVVEAEAAPSMEMPVMTNPQVDPVVAEDTEAETVAAFEKLDAVTHSSEAPVRSLLMPAPGRTLEDVIRELMQPMLKEWLDENLPAIVQARVDEEIERISRRRVR
jgi:cell pole-organizing protein PopZ